MNLDYVDGPPPVDPGAGDERTLVIHVSRNVVHPESAWATQVLYQLDPYRPLTNPLRGPAGMTGTVSLRAPVPSAGADAGETDGGDADAGASNASIVGCTIP